MSGAGGPSRNVGIGDGEGPGGGVGIGIRLLSARFHPLVLVYSLISLKRSV